MIDLETRLLEILEWDEDHQLIVYERAAKFLSECNLKDKGSIERALVQHFHADIPEEAARIVFKILDQNIRREMRIIEE